MSAFTSFKHIHLLRSDPPADSTVHQVPSIHLWFSGPVQIAVTTVRLTDSLNHVVETARPRAGDGSNGLVTIADVKGRVTPGRYSVAWRTMSRDGHVVSGHFAFRLAPASPGR